VVFLNISWYNIIINRGVNMSTATAKKANNQLSDGRPMRAMEGSVTQMQMFNPFPRGIFTPAVEGIAKVKDVDDALNKSGIYAAVMGSRWVRTDEYGVYHRDPTAPLGRELLWIEDGVLYRKIIPDVPVQFKGREISLQKVVGMGVYPSIGLLKVEQNDEKGFTVSPVSLDDIAGKVRAMNFMSGWAEPDEYGFPDGDKPGSVSSDTARRGLVREHFDNKATGYHGSLARYVDDFDGRRGVDADVDWSEASGVALVSCEVEVNKSEGELIVRGTPEQLEAALRLLEQLKK